MGDSFLEDFERRRQERLAADRTFTLAGERLTHKAAVAPEVAHRLEAMRRKVEAELAEARRRIETANGKPADLSDLQISDEAMIAAADDTILACLEADSHDGWARLRNTDAAYPLAWEDVMGIADWLLGRVSGIPTVAPADSSDGRTKTATSSKAASSSTGRRRKG